MTHEEIEEYEHEQAYIAAMWDEAMANWREDMKRIQEQLEARGFTPDEAEECALFELGKAPSL